MTGYSRESYLKYGRNPKFSQTKIHSQFFQTKEDENQESYCMINHIKGAAV